MQQYDRTRVQWQNTNWRVCPESWTTNYCFRLLSVGMACNSAVNEGYRSHTSSCVDCAGSCLRISWSGQLLRWFKVREVLQCHWLSLWLYQKCCVVYESSSYKVFVECSYLACKLSSHVTNWVANDDPLQDEIIYDYPHSYISSMCYSNFSFLLMVSSFTAFRLSKMVLVKDWCVWVSYLYLRLCTTCVPNAWGD